MGTNVPYFEEASRTVLFPPPRPGNSVWSFGSTALAGGGGGGGGSEVRIVQVFSLNRFPDVMIQTLKKVAKISQSQWLF